MVFYLAHRTKENTTKKIFHLNNFNVEVSLYITIIIITIDKR